MCEVCNAALETAANAAQKLASAAQMLYNINQHKSAEVLAEAAADLFRPEASKPNAGSGEVNGAQDTQAAEESDLERARRALNESLPEGVTIREDLSLVLNGKVIGQAMLVRR